MAPDKDSGASRQERKAKKRKLEDAIPDVPEDDTATAEVVMDVEKSSKKRKHSEPKDKDVTADNPIGKNKKKEKGLKKVETVEAKLQENPTGAAEDILDIDENGPRKSKKERKAERKAKEAAERAAIKGSISLAVNIAPATETIGATLVKTPDEKAERVKKNNRNREKKREAAKKAIADGVEPKAARFIVFIGNLPFTANKESIEKHFTSVKPKSVRALTQKDDPKKSKGCAFIEFDGYDHMKTCLKLFHHSMFDDGLSAPRKINVELSAGGGGNTQARKGKIIEKNQKLNEERTRRMMEEEKAKLVKKENGPSIDQNAIHPSRRGRVPDIS